ncbi:MAG TPA: hypothetical protein VFE61_12650 [Candidatus Sulfotelmatobacter sp.]|nr:hypothetical protein [Candidatus Sulfotelmatobacter sp.]
MKIVTYTLGAIVVLIASSIAAFYLYSSVVPRKSLQEFHLSESSPDGHLTVTVDGSLLGGMLAIHSAKQYQRGRTMILLVRAGITRAGLGNAKFHYEIRVPSDVDEISFGSPEDVIWRRKEIG